MRGQRVAILESRLGKELAGLVARRGGEPVHAPALAELPDLDRDAIGRLIESLEEKPAGLFVFQTGVGTKALFSAVEALGLDKSFSNHLENAKIAVRGPKPSAALRARKVRIDFSAAEPYTTRELLEAIDGVPLQGGRVVIQRHGVQNVELDRALEARGAQVAEIPTYKWSLPADLAPLANLVGAIGRDELHAVVFTNAEQVRNLFAVAESLAAGEMLKAALSRTLVASIGPVASAALRSAGVTVGLEASPPKLGALLEALDQALSA